MKDNEMSFFKIEKIKWHIRGHYLIYFKAELRIHPHTPKTPLSSITYHLM